MKTQVFHIIHFIENIMNFMMQTELSYCATMDCDDECLNVCSNNNCTKYISFVLAVTYSQARAKQPQ